MHPPSKPACNPLYINAGGDISEPRLLEVPLTVGNLATSAVVICCDLSKPNNCLASLLKWIKLIRNVVDLRLKELQATNSIAAAALKEAASLRCKGHDKDSKRLSPLEVSLYIVANKYDAFKSQSSADRRCLMQVC
jgi:Dynein light intermediate chain (DLIC)